MRLYLLSKIKLNGFNREILSRVLSDDRIGVVGVCFDTKIKSSYEKILTDLKKARGGYVFVQIFKKLIQNIFKRSSLEHDSTDAVHYYKKYRINNFIFTDTPYPVSIYRHIMASRPDAIFRMAFGIIKEPILSIAPKGVLSYHHGNIRSYRGQPVAFWELFNGEKKMSVTLQLLKRELDCGRIVVQRDIAIYPYDSWQSLYQRAHESSYDMLLEGCRLLDNGFSSIEIAEEELGLIYTKPNFRQWLKLQLKVLSRKTKYHINKRHKRKQY